MYDYIERYRIASDLFIDWLRNVRIFLCIESLLHILHGPIPSVPLDQAIQEVHDAFDKYMCVRAMKQGILLASMSSKLQSQHEDMEPQDIIMHLRELYG